ncbi:MAG: signal peptidase I [Bacteroidetes bacterium]|nr:MAG: signal peptidase I [Bacteroidota bacterium]
MPMSTDWKSFLEWFNLDYFRFPGLTTVKNLDVVVFNYPEGDTVSTVYQSNASYYRLLKAYGRKQVWNNKKKFGNIIYRPVDKRENYIKRCVAIAGDTLQIIDHQVYINGEEQPLPIDGQFKYRVIAPKGINEKFRDKVDISAEDFNYWKYDMQVPLRNDVAEKIVKVPGVNSVEMILAPKGNWDQDLFPYDSLYKWNRDNYGPIYIPQKGATIELSMDNISLYSRLIDVYENNDLSIKNGIIFINGSEANSYTFKMNYYWMMGDNRHNSADSRYWGFVPEDHIVGKASFVWLSLNPDKSLFDGKIRWDKLFRVVR